MKFRTEIPISKNLPRIRYADNIMSLGSCFSVEMGSKLSALRYRVLQNPAGITFNPVSIAHTIKMIKEGNSLPEHSLEHNGEQWCHPAFHSSLGHPDQSVALQQMNLSLQNAREFAGHCSRVIITLGTAIVYESVKDGMVVNNCHKLPAARFRKRRLDVEEITSQLDDACNTLEHLSERKISFLFTLSPVRHTREGFHENQHSKALCLLAIDRICNMQNNRHYFPSYEIMLDELRDYRFYKEDMIHPSPQAIDYIFEGFERYCLDDSESAIRKELQSILRARNHRPVNPGSRSHQAFLDKLNADIQAFNARHAEQGIRI